MGAHFVPVWKMVMVVKLVEEVGVPVALVQVVAELLEVTLVPGVLVVVLVQLVVLQVVLLALGLGVAQQYEVVQCIRLLWG